MATTEHRIRFKEVEVTPLSPSSNNVSSQKNDLHTSEQLDGSSALFAIGGQTERAAQSPKRLRGGRAKSKGKGKAVSRDTDSLKGSAKGARNGVGKGAGKPGSKPPSVKGSSKPGSVKSAKSASIKEKSRKTKAEVREKSVD